MNTKPSGWGTPAAIVICSLYCLCIQPTGLSALEPGFQLGLWWENSGDSDSDSLGLRLGFHAKHLTANFLVNKFILMQPRTVDLADFHFEVRSPILELGTMAAPDYWSCLSASRSSLDAVMPLDPETGRNADWLAHELPLRFASLSPSESARIAGAGIGLPRWLSAVIFRSLSGDYAGWDHLGLMGRLPLGGDSPVGSWTVDLGLAWYYSWFQPTGAPGSWVPAKDGSGVLIHRSEDWWLGGDLLRPQALSHGQVSVAVAMDWLRLVIIAQNSVPGTMRQGYSLACQAAFLGYQADGALVARLDLAAIHANGDYRGAHGIKPDLSGSLKSGLTVWPWPELAVQAGAGWEAGAVPEAGDYTARFRTSQAAWQTGIAYTGGFLRAGISLDGTRQTDELGLIANAENFSAMVAIETGNSVTFKLGVTAEWVMREWQAQSVKLSPLLDFGVIGEGLGFHFGMRAGLPRALDGGKVTSCVSASVCLALSWDLPGGDKMEVRGSLGLPENSTLARLGSWAPAEWWSHLDRRIEFSFNP